MDTDAYYQVQHTARNLHNSETSRRSGWRTQGTPCTARTSAACIAHARATIMPGAALTAQRSSAQHTIDARRPVCLSPVRLQECMHGPAHTLEQPPKAMHAARNSRSEPTYGTKRPSHAQTQLVTKAFTNIQVLMDMRRHTATPGTCMYTCMAHTWQPRYTHVYTSLSLIKLTLCSSQTKHGTCLHTLPDCYS